MRALEPDVQGRVAVDGVGIGYEVFGSGDRTVVLAPAWALVCSRFWKAQVPYLARRFRVVTWDAPGSGRSDRSEDLRHYGRDVRDGLAVLDATGTERALLVGLSIGAATSLFTASLHPERVAGVVAIGPTIPHLVDDHPWRQDDFEDDLGDVGWHRFSRASWRRDYPGFVEHFVREMLPEPHSEKQVEDCIGWGLDAGREVLERTMDAPAGYETREQAEALVARVRCPVLVIHGDDDRITPLACGARVAELTGGELVVLEGAGHTPQARDPVKVNVLLDAFAERVLGAPRQPERRWRRALSRGNKRALLVSSPIGLGHARRDMAIARELRALVPGLEIDWLALHPLTAALEAAGERVHPASARLANESAHLESLSGAHTLPIFQAIREMDEILINNYMVFRDVVRETPYDLWIGDEAWDVDHFLHENPEDKQAPFVFLTDFVGWLPLPEGGEREAFLCADLNALMIEQVERFPFVRDRALFVGEPEDVVPRSFGPGLPEMRDWVPRHFEFVGQTTVAAEPFERNGGGPLCVAAVGGSGVGEGLLARLVAGYGAAAEQVPGLRMLAVTGPRVDPEQLRAPDGVEVRAYVPDLDRVLATADVALVQGGLTTGMELIAGGTPFVSFPLKRHFEQRIHVAHRLARHGHARALEVEDATPEGVAAAVAGALAEPVDYRPVASGGAARAAQRIAELL